jgi:Helicase conserved C-terminal domain
VSEYAAFLHRKSQLGGEHGFSPLWIPDALFGFQRFLVEWSLRRGRAALLADCGLGKTAMQLVWAENVARHANGRVLILTPLAVGRQTVHEGEKFGVECSRAESARIVVANYERLHHFTPSDFSGVVCDESSILKSFDGKTRQALTEFMRTIPLRLLCTATAAPNDYVELGTSSEALGELGHMDMLNRFFVNDQNTSDIRARWRGYSAPHEIVKQQWRFKGHAETAFWKWVCSWARACRKPSDLGFDDDGFHLPPIEERSHVVSARTLPPGMLFPSPAVGLREEREERRRTIAERCEKVAELVDDGEQAVVWCHLNEEGNRLAAMIPGARQITGNTDETEREDIWESFTDGALRVVVVKPKIGAWGLNLQNCAHVVSFASHSYEQHYQAVRRCWRFGQTRPVTVDVVSTEGEAGVAENLRRKSAAADRMFSSLVEHMNGALRIERRNEYVKRVEVPSWLSLSN